MSKLNPQKASAYVGPGVLRKGGKITPVPNGPLIKKKGPYAGSTLKAGGKVKKAMLGAIMNMAGGKDNPIYKKTTAMRGKLGNAMGIPGKPIVKNGSAIKKAQNGKTTTTKTTKKPIPTAILPSMQTLPIKSKPYTDKQKDSLIDSWKKEIDSKFLKKKAGGMIKRADGSYSKRGLWDNIRANKGSGKKPTKQMLQQEKKIKAKTKK